MRGNREREDGEKHKHKPISHRHGSEISLFKFRSLLYCGRSRDASSPSSVCTLNHKGEEERRDYYYFFSFFALRVLFPLQQRRGGGPSFPSSSSLLCQAEASKLRTEPTHSNTREPRRRWFWKEAA